MKIKNWLPSFHNFLKLIVVSIIAILASIAYEPKYAREFSTEEKDLIIANEQGMDILAQKSEQAKLVYDWYKQHAAYGKLLEVKYENGQKKTQVKIIKAAEKTPSFTVIPVLNKEHARLLCKNQYILGDKLMSPRISGQYDPTVDQLFLFAENSLPVIKGLTIMHEVNHARTIVLGKCPRDCTGMCIVNWEVITYLLIGTVINQYTDGWYFSELAITANSFATSFDYQTIFVLPIETQDLLSKKLAEKGIPIGNFQINIDFEYAFAYQVFKNQPEQIGPYLNTCWMEFSSQYVSENNME